MAFLAILATLLDKEDPYSRRYSYQIFLSKLLGLYKFDGMFWGPRGGEAC